MNGVVLTPAGELRADFARLNRVLAALRCPAREPAATAARREMLPSVFDIEAADGPLEPRRRLRCRMRSRLLGHPDFWEPRSWMLEPEPAPKTARWPVYLACAALAALAIGVAAKVALGATVPSYLGLSINGATSLNTDQDEFEASTNPYPTIAAFVGRDLWSAGGWSIAAEARCFWWQQRAHGSGEESVDGRFMAAGCMAGPVVAYDFGPLSLFGSFGAGPAWQDIDVTNGSQTGRNRSKSGVELAIEPSGGVQVPISDDWFMRARGFWSRAGEIKQAGGGVELAMRLQE